MHIEEMEALACSTSPFSPAAWFEPELDQLVFHLVDEPYFERRVDRWLTVFGSMEEPEKVVGFKIKGFAWLYERIVHQGRVHDDGFFALVDLLDFAWLIAASKAHNDEDHEISSEPVDAEYRRAKEIADDHKINQDELHIAA